MSRNTPEVKNLSQTIGGASASKPSPAPKSPLSKLFAEEEEAALAATGGKTSGVFTEYTDVSKFNDGSHKDSRLDTFKTPPSLNKRFNTPLRADRRWGLGDTHDLIEICEVGFAKSMQKLGKEILKDSREELAKAMVTIRNDTLESKVREESTGTMLSEVHSLVQQVHEVTKAPSKLDFSNADLAPLAAYLSRGEAERSETQREFMQQLEAQVLASISKIREDMIDLKQRHDATEKVLIPQILEEVQKGQHDIAEMCHRSEAQLNKLVSMQESLVEKVPNAVESVGQHVESVGQRYSGTLESILETRILHLFQTQSVKVDFSHIVGRVASTERSVVGEIDCLGQEIAKIQQALHLDFAQVIDGIMEIKKSPDEPEKSPRPSILPAHNEPIITTLEVAHSSTDNSARANRQTTAPRGRRGAAAHQIQNCRDRKRVREFYTQTETAEYVDQWTMTDKSLMKKQKPKLQAQVKDALGPQDGPKLVGKAVFADAEQMRQKARQAAIRPQYNVFDYYYKEGRIQAIAKSRAFEWTTLSVIFINSLWIAVDTDLNDSDTLVGADTIFVVAENLFCSYFTFEISLRFLAFDGKMHCLFDSWFVFDSVLVALMVFETWIFTFVFLMAGGDGGSLLAGEGTLFRVVRLVKMLRISRLTRLLRSIPELVIIIKGIGAASRSVIIFLAMWFVVVYIFAILFRQVTEETDLGQKYFKNVPVSMNTLLVDGILPDNENILTQIMDSSPFVWPLFMIFILLACITLMYMLVGVLVDVISSIAESEKESMTVSHIANQMRELVYDDGLFEGEDTESTLTKHQFEKLVIKPEVAFFLNQEGVDVVVLLDMADIIFEDIEKNGKNAGGGMSFEQLVELVLHMRGTNPATVKDMKEQLRVMKAFLQESSKAVTEHMTSEVKQLRQLVVDLKEHQDREADSDDDDDYADADRTSNMYRESQVSQFSNVLFTSPSAVSHELPSLTEVEDVE